MDGRPPYPSQTYPGSAFSERYLRYSDPLHHSQYPGVSSVNPDVPSGQGYDNTPHINIHESPESQSAYYWSNYGQQPETYENSGYFDTENIVNHEPGPYRGSNPGQIYLPTETTTQYTGPIRSCSNCGTTKTSQWRKEPGTERTLCNSCGLYYRTRRSHRPRELIEADLTESSAGHDASRIQPVQRCSHCQRQNTPAWRRGPNGQLLCNACGMYLRTNHRDRPLELQKSEKIRPRAPSWTR